MSNQYKPDFSENFMYYSSQILENQKPDCHLVSGWNQKSSEESFTSKVGFPSFGTRLKPNQKPDSKIQDETTGVTLISYLKRL